MAYSTEEQWFTDWENGGPYYAVPAKHERHNPVRYANQWKTAMLVVQGDLDFRIPTAQGLSTFTALQRCGIDSQLLVSPDENHWVSEARQFTAVASDCAGVAGQAHQALSGRPA